jgi:hypothetical protein
LKTEGTYNGNNSFFYHLGGFKAPYPSVRKVIPNGQQNFTIQKNSNKKINLAVALDKMFTGLNLITVSSQPDITNPSPMGSKMADNCASMFSIQSIQ